MIDIGVFALIITVLAALFVIVFVCIIINKDDEKREHAFRNRYTDVFNDLEKCKQEIDEEQKTRVGN